MNQLDTKRQAAERRRVVLMSQGIANFLDRTSIESGHSETAASAMKNHPGSRVKKAVPQPANYQTSTTQHPDELASTMDQIRVTFNQAASILRESLELTSGGVVFLDTTIYHADTGSTDAYLDETTMIGAQFVQSEKEQSSEVLSNGGSTLRPPVHEIGEIASQQSDRKHTDRRELSKVQAISAAEIGMCSCDHCQLLHFELKSCD